MKFQGYERAFFSDLEAVDGSDGVVLGLAAVCGEGFEIVFALECVGGAAHGIEIEGGGEMPGAA